jgi:SlyX protein
MEPPHDIEQRLTDLEVKSTFTEDLVDRLNQEIIRQQRHLDILVREMRELRQQVAQADTGTPPGPRDELPPHY